MRRLVATTVALAVTIPVPAISNEIDFGDDASEFARDGECDDSRFEGPGMTDTILLDSDIGHDATDCRVAYKQGRVTLKGAVPPPPVKGVDVPLDMLDFGNDDSEFARDGECDDPRFVGAGMASDLLTRSIGRDASDCRSAFESGRIQLNRLFLDPSDEQPIDYGSNTADFANDGECDDIRFTGKYASGMIYLVEDIGTDASDCRAAFKAGNARWQGKTATPNYGAVEAAPKASESVEAGDAETMAEEAAVAMEEATTID